MGAKDSLSVVAPKFYGAVWRAIFVANVDRTDFGCCFVVWIFFNFFEIYIFEGQCDGKDGSQNDPKPDAFPS